MGDQREPSLTQGQLRTPHPGTRWKETGEREKGAEGDVETGPWRAAEGCGETQGQVHITDKNAAAAMRREAKSAAPTATPLNRRKSHHIVL